MGCSSSKVHLVTVTSRNVEAKEISSKKQEDGGCDQNNNRSPISQQSIAGHGTKALQSSQSQDERKFEQKAGNEAATNVKVEKEKTSDDIVTVKEKTLSGNSDGYFVDVTNEIEKQVSDIVATTEDKAGLISNKADKSVAPKRKLKSQLFSSLEVFKDVDAHAKKAPLDSANSFEVLAGYLSKPFDSELFKARSIWIWVTSNIAYDTDAFFSNNLSEAADESNALKTGKAVCSGYSSLVSALCSCSGLESKEIHGFAKGYSYKIGQKFEGGRTNHSWTTIRIQGQWWLFDFTWGAGYVGSDKQFAWNYTEHYFMTDPELFVLDHFPVDTDWQLITPSYDIKEFEQWAKFSKHFFINELTPKSHKNGIIETDDGKVNITVGSVHPVKAIVNLEQIGENEIKTLSEYSFVQIKDADILLSARLPEVGKYNLKLFASRFSKEQSKSHDLVVSYQINNTAACQDCQPFPKSFSSWHPGYFLYQPSNGILAAEVSVPFQIEAPGVTEMHISTTGGKGEWFSLQKSEKGFWEGNVTFSTETTAATVVVKVDGQTSTTFSGILKYAVK